MATSPLTAALKPNVSAGDEAEQKYQEALSELMERLDSRKNRMFDPTMLAMAQGFLTPGQTGSFGESLGNVAQKVGVAQQQQEKEDLNVSQLRLQVAQGAREQAARLKGQEAFRSLAGGAPTAAPGAGQPAAPAGQGAPTAQANQARPVRMEDALKFAAAYPEQKELAKLLADAAKFESDRYKIAMNGTVFDTVTGNYVGAIPPGQTASKYLVPEVGGEVLMTPGQHAQYQEARVAGKGKEWVRNFMSAEGPGKGGEAQPLTSGDIEARAAAKKAEEESVAKANADRYNNAIAKGDDAGSRIALFKRIVSTASQKDADKILGVFETGKFGDAVLQYMEANNGMLGVKNIRDIWTNLGLDPKLIADKQVLLSLIAQSQFDFRALAKGQGAISDMETKLFNSMGADIADRPEAVIRKMKMLERRAEFDREVSRMARAARKQGASFDDMKDTDAYRKAYETYVDDLMKQVTGAGRNAPAAPVPAKSPNPAANKLRKELGIE